MYTTDFIRYLAHKHRRYQAPYRQALRDILEGITDQLAHGQRVQLIGFGTFYTREQPEGTVTNVRTGRLVKVPAHRVAAFRVGELLKRTVRKHPVGRPRKGLASVLLARTNRLLTQPRHRHHSR